MKYRKQKIVRQKGNKEREGEREAIERGGERVDRERGERGDRERGERVDREKRQRGGREEIERGGERKRV